MILTFTRAQVVAFAQSGLMNIKSATHWDICNDLKSGMHPEEVSMKHDRMSLSQIRRIRECKCPEV